MKCEVLKIINKVYEQNAIPIPILWSSSHQVITVANVLIAVQRIDIIGSANGASLSPLSLSESNWDVFYCEVFRKLV